ncbi:MAG TPA: hypothetical protein VFK57_06160 [Vicinamibacterales bacterium]|nr:hypothetical protein [Vicinamibacterales bacterium]
MPIVFTPSRSAGVLAASLGALLLAIIPVQPSAQGGQAPVAPLPPPINQSSDPLLRSFRFRSIGPASMGGRIDDIAVSETDPNVIYLGYAVGGVWKSENNGVTFEPVFDTYSTASIGDIAIHPRDPNVVYVGTGEPNNRQTSSFGDGIYKTTDGGRTFTHIGLKDTQTIARIVIDPKNPETVYVASPGHLFGPNPERGVYKSTDGGKNWNLVKFIDDDTGFTDIAIDPANTSTLYAASYQRRRSGCCFNGGGPGSGLWKTTDAGRTWTKLTNGLPPGTYGRIALDVSRSNPNVVYVQIEAGQVGQPLTTPGVQQSAATEATPAGAAAVVPPVTAPAQPPTPTPPPAGRGRAAGVPPQPGTTQPGGGRAGGAGRGQAYNWCNNAGPGRGFPIGRGGQTAQGDPPTVPPLDPARGGVFRSENKGQSWTLVSNCNARPMYFSQVRVDPANDRTVYVAGLPIYKSLDGGRSFASLDEAGGHGDPGHVDQHALWIDPRNPKHLLIGNDGGLNISWDQGRSWDFVNTMATALPYIVSADMRRPYYVYIGLQDNGSWGGPSAVRGRGGIMNSHWFGIGGGDGFHTAVDPTDHNIVFTESQDGNTNRYDLRTGRGQSVRPNAGGRGGRGNINVLNAAAGDVYRFNWNTPFQISPHNPKIFWLGGNRLFKSYNQGETYVASPDLTRSVDRNTVALMGVPGNVTQLSKNDGVVSHSTITTLSESPVMPGVVWVGTDDGNVQVSRDGGATFTEVSRNLPGLAPNVNHWISRVEASHFDQATAYVSVDDHRADDLKPYIFATKDFGKTFESITGNLPPFGNVQVIREDPKNPDLLFAGTEFGLYVTLDRGRNWQKFMNNYPTVRTDDILIHPRDNDLIVATHGRSVWIADDITPLQQLTPAVKDADVTLFDIRPAVAWLNDQQNNQQVGGQKVFVGENAPRGAAINYYLKAAASGDVKITIADATGRVIRTLDGPKTAGLNRVMWNLAPQPQQPAPGGGFGGGRGGGAVGEGTYVVTLEVGGRKLTRPLQVLRDEWLNQR